VGSGKEDEVCDDVRCRNDKQDTTEPTMSPIDLSIKDLHGRRQIGEHGPSKLTEVYPTCNTVPTPRTLFPSPMTHGTSVIAIYPVRVEPYIQLLSTKLANPTSVAANISKATCGTGNSRRGTMIVDSTACGIFCRLNGRSRVGETG
jgi:hypothetical protein